jgi:pimeloyl-ACP methyl ester carboxylesterase
MAQDLRHLMVQYDMTQAVLLGHSMGALTVWEYIRQFGCDRLAGICLLDQSPRLLNDDTWKLGIYGHFNWQDNHRFVTELKADFAEAVLQLGANGANSHVTRSYQQNTLGIQALRNYLQSLHPRPLIQCWESLIAADYRSVLPTISVPTLLIHGSESQFYSPAVAHYVQNAIPNSSLHLYEGADHFPQIWQKVQFIEDVRRFVKDLDR